MTQHQAFGQDANDEPQRDVLTLAEAAKLLRLGLEATKALFRRGELAGATLNQKHVIFLRADLLLWVRDKAHEQTAKRAAAAKGPLSIRARGRSRRPLPDLSKY